MANQQDPKTITLSEFVRITMHTKGLSSYDVQRRGGIDQSYVTRIKNGDHKNPSAAKLQALAKGLGVSEEEIFAATGGRKIDPSDFHKRLISVTSESETWTRDQKDFVLELVRLVAAGFRQDQNTHLNKTTIEVIDS